MKSQTDIHYTKICEYDIISVHHCRFKIQNIFLGTISSQPLLTQWVKSLCKYMAQLLHKILFVNK